MDKKNHAFTLAEVLITLGIIGVVAALTMPSLIANYQKKQAVVRLQKAYSGLSQAVKLSQAQNGDVNDWDWDYSNANATTKTEYMIQNYFEPYFTGLKFCSTGADYKCGAPVSASGLNYLLNDNTGLSFVFNSTQGNIIVDVNGGQPPNKIGRDVFYFMFWKDDGRVLPYNWAEGASREAIINGYSGSPYSGACNNNGGLYDKYNCTWLIMTDGWEIKDDYPW